MKYLIVIFTSILLSCSNNDRTTNGAVFLQSNETLSKKCELVQKLYGTKIIHSSVFYDYVSVKDKDDKIFILHMSHELASSIFYSNDDIKTLPRLDCNQVSSVE